MLKEALEEIEKGESLLSDFFSEIKEITRVTKVVLKEGEKFQKALEDFVKKNPDANMKDIVNGFKVFGGNIIKIIDNSKLDDDIKVEMKVGFISEFVRSMKKRFGDNAEDLAISFFPIDDSIVQKVKADLRNKD